MSKPKTNETWRVFKELNNEKLFDEKNQQYIQSFHTHDEVENWIRTKGDRETTYLVQHLINGRQIINVGIPPFDEQWTYTYWMSQYGWQHFDWNIPSEYLDSRSDRPEKGRNKPHSRIKRPDDELKDSFGSAFRTGTGLAPIPKNLPKPDVSTKNGKPMEPWEQELLEQGIVMINGEPRRLETPKKTPDELINEWKRKHDDPNWPRNYLYQNHDEQTQSLEENALRGNPNVPPNSIIRDSCSRSRGANFPLS